MVFVFSTANVHEKNETTKFIFTGWNEDYLCVK